VPLKPDDEGTAEITVWDILTVKTQILIVPQRGIAILDW